MQRRRTFLKNSIITAKALPSQGIPAYKTKNESLNGLKEIQKSAQELKIS